MHGVQMYPCVRVPISGLGPMVLAYFPYNRYLIFLLTLLHGLSGRTLTVYIQSEFLRQCGTSTYIKYYSGI